MPHRATEYYPNERILNVSDENGETEGVEWRRKLAPSNKIPRKRIQFYYRLVELNNIPVR
jgi:hypothetical protein